MIDTSNSLPARAAWEQVQALCSECPRGCAAYHRVQPMLRRLGLAAEPNHHRSFFLPAIVAALEEVGPKVLISGSVDEAMVEMVVQAAIEADRKPAITVLDRCATSLAVVRAFARNAPLAIDTVHSDILDYPESRGFDLVVTHSFLGYFAPEKRPELMSRWFDLLRPGGRMVTAARLRPHGEARTFSANSANRFAREVARRAHGYEQETGIPAEELARVAHVYAANRPRSFPLTSVDDLNRLLVRAGFSVRRIAAREMPARVTGIEGPALPREGRYVEVIAERPAS